MTELCPCDLELEQSPSVCEMCFQQKESHWGSLESDNHRCLPFAWRLSDAVGGTCGSKVFQQAEVDLFVLYRLSHVFETF